MQVGGEQITIRTAGRVKSVAEIAELPVIEVLRRLQAAGMDSLPGGGAEIFDDVAADRITTLERGKGRSASPR